MKKLIFFCCFLLGFQMLEAQNCLPFTWNIHFTDSASVRSRNCPTDSIVNLLLSWERQGYCAADGACLLSTACEIEDPSRPHELNVCLQCTVSSLRLNGKELLSAPIPNGRATRIVLPNGLLQKGSNRIVVHCNQLAYTGGHSSNSLTLQPTGAKQDEYIQIEFDSPNHVYTGSQNRILTLRSHTKKNAQIRLLIENDFHKQLLDTCFQIMPQDSLLHLNLDAMTASPGFYQCVAMLHGEGYSGDVQWIAVQPEAVTCPDNRPPHFDSYWTTAQKELEEIAPRFRIHKIDSLSARSTRDVFIVEMQSLGHITIRGYYFVPRSQGTHYAILHLPGYGQGFHDLSAFMNEQTERIDLALCVRGHGISADQFRPGFGIPGIWGYQICNQDSIAYRGVYMDALRAVDFLYSRPEVDHRRIGTIGGSQGDGLALLAAALRPKQVAACAFFDPFPCDIRHQTTIRTIWETELKNYLAYYPNCCTYEDALCIQDLLNIRSFAPQIHCHVHFATGLFDDDCPPHGSFTLYNSIPSSNKQYTVYPHDSHIGESNYTQMLLEWFDKLFTSL